MTVTAIAPDADRLQVLNADTRRAWQAYSTRTRGLAGAEYEQAERESWSELQTELRRLERQREALNQTTS